jgi:hypothetical protein
MTALKSLLHCISVIFLVSDKVYKCLLAQILLLEPGKKIGVVNASGRKTNIQPIQYHQHHWNVHRLIWFIWWAVRNHRNQFPLSKIQSKNKNKHHLITPNVLVCSNRMNKSQRARRISRKIRTHEWWSSISRTLFLHRVYEYYYFGVHYNIHTPYC